MYYQVHQIHAEKFRLAIAYSAWAWANALYSANQQESIGVYMEVEVDRGRSHMVYCPN